ncbi:DDB1- and CUL4-associated factor 17-like [Brevipalpus obovatus]|uniref:DDB1- and CUL4-associated factor 17-like n=1 Tax=Brevipalpus obovatus TaxID=246614 RepID=UPI003D9DCA3B
MPSKNCINRLFQRETGCFLKYPRLDCQMIRRLYYEPDEYEFSLLWNENKKKGVLTLCDKIFINSRDCYSLDKITRGSHPLSYSISDFVERSKLGHDKMLAHKGPHNTTPDPSKKFRPFLLVLTKDNFLLQFDLDNGNLLEKIFLGDPERAKFLYITWYRYYDSVVLQTGDMRNSSGRSTFLKVMILRVNPLQIVTCFRIPSNLFGKVESAAIDLEMIRTSTPVVSKKTTYCIYSLKDLIAPENCEFPIKIGEICRNYAGCEECETSVSRVVGVGGHGIPVNLTVNEPPPLVFSVEIGTPFIDHGGYPPKLIYTPAGEVDGTYHVARFTDRTLQPIGQIKLNSHDEGQTSAQFHTDYSDRIIVVNKHSISMCCVIDNHFMELYEIYMSNSVFEKSKLNEYISKQETSAFPRTIFGYDYDESTDVLAVIGIDPSSNRPRGGIVALFDNQTGQLIRREFLEALRLEDEDDLEIVFALDELMILQKPNSTCCNIFYYRFLRKISGSIKARPKRRKTNGYKAFI